MGSEPIRKIFKNHGAKGPLFGVKIGDLKTIQKKVKKNYELSKELYATGNSDAMYLAGLIADEKKMTKADLQQWVKNATWYMMCEYTVAWVAAESAYGWELALEWIGSDDEHVAVAGWSTLGGLLALEPDEKIDKALIEDLLERVVRTIHSSKNRVRYVMNGFVIAVGGYVPSLSQKAIEAGKKIGKVNVEMGGTACKVPSSTEYIQKMADRGNIGKKKKTVRC